MADEDRFYEVWQEHILARGVSPEVKGSFEDYDVSKVRDDRAAVAIKGMPPSPLADQLRAFEKLRIGDGNSAASEQLRILREEVAALAMAYGKLQNTNSALPAREDFYQQFLTLTAEKRDFRKFLLDHFEADMLHAEALNIPILGLAKSIMLDLKKRRGFWQRFFGL